MKRRVLVVRSASSAASTGETGQRLAFSELDDVVEVPDGPRALAALAAETFDAVVVPHPLPDGGDAFELLHAVRAGAATADLAVIVVARAGAYDVEQRALDEGADDVAFEDATRRALAQRVARAVRHRQPPDVLARVVHDLKNPLAIVHTNLGWAQDELGTRAPDVSEALGDAAIATEQLRALLDDLSMLARLGGAPASTGPLPTLRLETVAVAPLVREVTCTLQSRAAVKRLRLDDAAPEDVRVDCEAVLVRRALERLVEAAIRSTASEGHVRVESRPGSFVELVVRSEGPTRPPNAPTRTTPAGGQLARAFGLGPHFAERVAVAHGGALDAVRDDEGRLAFVLRLPRHAPRPA
jgi:signal transduction histidine kinase